MVLEVPVLEMLSLSLMSIMAAAAEVVVGGSTSFSLLLQWPSVCSVENGNPACAVAFTDAGTEAAAAAAAWADDLRVIMRAVPVGSARRRRRREERSTRPRPLPGP